MNALVVAPLDHPLVASLFDALVQAHRFSARERSVLQEVLLGRSSAAIARQLGLRETTVHKHLHSIFARTETESRQRLCELALRLAAQRRVVQPRPLAVAA
ncbi:MAG TPA: helix-turn-helix domain-containing protein [Enhygromyxa sp.]|nr:helix-turn-helix domain-containing protein [Enhygromyxa sp.]